MLREDDRRRGRGWFGTIGTVDVSACVLGMIGPCEAG